MAKQKSAKNSANPVTVAVVQAASVAFNRKQTLAKVLDLTGDAAKKGAGLVLFPEAFVSGYPRGLDFGAVVGARSIKAGRTSSDTLKVRWKFLARMYTRSAKPPDPIRFIW